MAEGFGNVRIRLVKKCCSTACDLWSMGGEPWGHSRGTCQQVPTEPFTPFASAGSLTKSVLILKQNVLNKLNKWKFLSFHNHILNIVRLAGLLGWAANSRCLSFRCWALCTSTFPRLWMPPMVYLTSTSFEYISWTLVSACDPSITTHHISPDALGPNQY